MSIRTGVCVICRDPRKPTLSGIISVFGEDGRTTPVLEIEVCEACIPNAIRGSKPKIGGMSFE